MPGDVYAVASGKGGVGKTTTVVNLGVVLRRANHSVALVDADLGMANLGTVLGVEGEATIHDVLSGEATLDEALVEEAAGFAVLVGSRDLASYPDADPAGLKGIIGTLSERYDVVLVDTGAGISYEDVLPLGLVDGVILVTTPDPAAVGDTTKTAQLTGLSSGVVEGLVVTHAGPTTDATHIASQIGVELLGVIPHDSAVRESTAAGRPLEAMAPDSPGAAAYRELASTLRGEAVAPPPEVTGTTADDAESTPEAAESSEPADETDGGTDGTASTSSSAGSDDDEPVEADEEAGDDEESLDEYLEEFEDEGADDGGSFFGRLRRLLR